MKERTLEELYHDLHTSAYGSQTIQRIVDEIGPESTGLKRALYLSCSAAIEGRHGNRERASQLIDESLAIANELGDSLAQSRALAARGYMFWTAARLKEALESFYEALATTEDEDLPGRGYILNGIAVVFGDTGDSEKSLEYFERALEYFRSDDSSYDELQVIGNIALLYGQVDEYDRAAELLEKHIVKASGERNNRLRANFVGNLGYAYSKLGKDEEAVELQQQAIELSLEYGMSREVGYNATGLAETLLNVGDVDAAMKVLEEYKEHIAANPIPALVAERLSARFEMHRGNVEKAMSMFDAAYKKCEEKSLPAGQLDVAEDILELAKQMGDFEKYVAYNELCSNLRKARDYAQTARSLALRDKEQEFAQERQQILQERDRERAILYSTLPDHVADRLINGEQVTDHFDDATVLFLDIARFTSISDRIPAGHVVHLLKAIFKICDDVCKKHGVTKIKTIGDSYMAVAGVPEPLEDHAQRAASAALEMMKGLDELELTMDPSLGDTSWTEEVGEIAVRIGLHCGPVVAGVVGDERLQYDVWGDTVNVASRMESSGEAERIQVSAEFAKSWDQNEQDPTSAVTSIKFTPRGEVDIKGKGTMTTYWLEGA